MLALHRKLLNQTDTRYGIRLISLYNATDCIKQYNKRYSSQDKPKVFFCIFAEEKPNNKNNYDKTDFYFTDSVAGNPTYAGTSTRLAC